MSTREYIYNNQFKVQVNPDIAARGGEKGKGCVTYIWPLDSDGNVIPDLRGDQGPHSLAMVKRLIKHFEKRGAK